MPRLCACHDAATFIWHKPDKCSPRGAFAFRSDAKVSARVIQQLPSSCGKAPTHARCDYLRLHGAETPRL